MTFPLTDLAAFAWPLQFCLFTTAATYVASLITTNVSQVDRLWTFLPTIYSAYFALLPLWPQSKQPFYLCPYVPDELSSAAQSFSPRALLMLTVTVVWMSRLSYNTWRRGLFSLKDEDYRWAVLRSQLPVWLFQVTNLVFISGIQNVLLLLLGHPTFVAVQQPHEALSKSDIALGCLSLLVLATEFTADNQQFAFHSFKHSILGSKESSKPYTEPYDEKKQWPGARLNWIAEDAKRGFVTRGLWAYTRHPNFVCEQTFWWIITFIPLLSPAAPSLPHYTFSQIQHGAALAWEAYRSRQGADAVIVGASTAAGYLSGMAADWVHSLTSFVALLPPVCLSLLFFSSTKYTEAISLSKYPVTYKAYQERVGMFGPVRTFEKGLFLRWKGQEKLKQVNELVWGNAGGLVKEKEL